MENDLRKCWGDGDYGGLGQGDGNHRGDGASEMGAALPPIDLGASRYAVSIAAATHICALLNTQEIVCWGENGGGGKLGRGENLSQTPQIGNAANQMGTNLMIVNLGSL